MKYSSLTIAGLLFLPLFSFSHTTTAIDIHKLVQDNGLVVYNRELSLVNEGSHLGISLKKDEGEGIA